MTPKAQRIAIAEACGWKPVGEPVTYGWLIEIDEGNKAAFFDELPDYLFDLNAMHEAEKKFMGMEGNIPHPMEAVYYHHLREIVDRFPGTLVYHATAAQRAEAFLRTLNLWKE